MNGENQKEGAMSFFGPEGLWYTDNIGQFNVTIEAR